MNKKTVILAIESSCDDTSAAIIQNGQVLSNIVDNQEVHKNYGGVVPELASREHLSKIVPVVEESIKKANITKEDISAIAFTRGPGLLGSLIVGVNFAKSLSLALDIPLIEVHHMQAHVMAHFAAEPHPAFPFLCLTVSGGHTQIVRVDDHDQMHIIGETKDDAAGEAFDKSGKILGLSYPSGPEIDKRAKNGTAKFSFSTSKMSGYDFSFSGLKTSILYFLKKQVKENPDFIEENLNDICASIQSTIVGYLLEVFERACLDQDIEHIGIAGGVSANSELRNAMQDLAQKHQWKCYIPDFQYCTDNAAMIGIVGYHKFLKGDFTDQSVFPQARMVF